MCIARRLGVDPSNVLTMQINLPEAKYRRDEDQVAFHEQLKGKLESLPGVESVALASAMPTSGYWYGSSHLRAGRVRPCDSGGRAN